MSEQSTPIFKVLRASGAAPLEAVNRATTGSGSQSFEYARESGHRAAERLRSFTEGMDESMVAEILAGLPPQDNSRHVSTTEGLVEAARQFMDLNGEACERAEKTLLR